MTHHVALQFAASTDAGKVRGHNEDAIQLDEAQGIAVLADGMGGYNAGEIASGIAVTAFTASLTQRLEQAQGARRALGSRMLERMLSASVEAANEAILAAAASQPEFSGMGTTLVAALFHAGRIVVAHLGDSRAYRFRQGVLTQLTRDHSQLQEQIDAGLVSPEWARFAPNKNLITRALGVVSKVNVETGVHAIEEGDVYLLCSDGLSDMLSAGQIADLLAQEADLDASCAALVDAANDNGGRDNISVILARVGVIDIPEPLTLRDRWLRWLGSCMPEK